MMVLTLKFSHGKLAGTLTQPRHFTEDWNGDFVGINLPVIKLSAVGKWNGDHAELTTCRDADQDTSSMDLADRDHLLVGFFHGVVPDWKFQRVSAEGPTSVDTDWPEFVSDPEIASIRHQLKAMAQADKEARERQTINQDEIKKLSDDARPFLQQIYSVYGWPKISIFGAQSSDDYWLLVQHQPLVFQEQILPVMKTAVDAGEATKRNYAYLFDRVQVEHGKPQHWGTQSHCENKQAVLYAVDNPTQLEHYREEAGLEPLPQSLRAASSICKKLQ